MLWFQIPIWANSKDSFICVKFCSRHISPDNKSAIKASNFRPIHIRSKRITNH